MGRFLPSTSQEAREYIGDYSNQSEGTTKEESPLSPISTTPTEGTYRTMGDVVDDPLEHVTFEFPITNQERATEPKNIPPSALPVFYGLVTEYPNTFMFEFDVLCRSYDYTFDAHRLELFPTTLKDVSLR